MQRIISALTAENNQLKEDKDKMTSAIVELKKEVCEKDRKMAMSRSVHTRKMRVLSIENIS